MPGITRVTMDRSTLSATVTLADGKQSVWQLTKSPFEPSSTIVRMVHIPSSNLLELETNRGDIVISELPNGTAFAPRRGRPIIYLDQKDWSTLAKTLYQPKKVLPSAEREAAEALIDLARQKKVILPMSAAHMSETCKWTNDEERYRLALTIVQLSVGWQMRDPLDIRRFEIAQTFAARFRNMCLIPRANFTLEPHAIHGGRRAKEDSSAGVALPPDMALVVEVLVSTSSSIDTMLDAESVPMNPTPEWVKKFQAFTDWLGGESRSAQKKRESINVFFLADTRREIAEAAAVADLSRDELSDWFLVHSDADITAMPGLGLFGEVLVGKHLNRGTKWEENDLTDLMYLTCAAAYADYVVGENSLVSQMEQALKRLGRPLKVHRRLRDLKSFH